MEVTWWARGTSARLNGSPSFKPSPCLQAKRKCLCFCNSAYLAQFNDYRFQSWETSWEFRQQEKQFLAFKWGIKLKWVDELCQLYVSEGHGNQKLSEISFSQTRLTVFNQFTLKEKLHFDMTAIAIMPSKTALSIESQLPSTHCLTWFINENQLGNMQRINYFLIPHVINV